MRHRTVAILLLLALTAGCVGVFSGITPEDDTDSVGETLSFEEVAVEVGLDYDTSGKNLGKGDGGILTSDYDNDGTIDVVTIGSGPTLFENTGGAFERTDALPEIDDNETVKINSGLFFDYDNDGWDDLVLFGLDHDPFFFENTGGAFERREVGLTGNFTWPTGASAADYDGDGCLDLFVTQIGDWRETVPQRSISGMGSVNDTNDNGFPNVLFRGTCGGDFERVEDAGIHGNHWSMTSSFVDLSGDGRPDIHVANDFYNDVVYVNRGNGTFEQRTIPGTNRQGMSSEIEDVNGDGYLDVFVTNMEFENPETVWVLHNGIDVVNRGNNLLLNQGNATFVDRAEEYDVKVGSWGWSANFVDLNNDGHLDLVHSTSYFARQAKSGQLNTQNTLPRLWTGNGSGFARVNESAAGLVPTDGRGLTAFDYDDDGAVDVFVTNTVGPFRLFRNAAENPGNYTEVRLAGTENQTAIGSRVHVTLDGETTVKAYNSKSNYFSQNPRLLHVGLGEAAVVDRIRVVFPDGTERVLEDVAANHEIVVHYNGTVTHRD